MKRLQGVFPVLLVVAALVAGGLATAQQKPAIAHTNLKVGDMAPDFTLPDNGGHQVKLSEFRGKKSVILAFYVLAFTGG